MQSTGAVFSLNIVIKIHPLTKWAVIFMEDRHWLNKSIRFSFQWAFGLSCFFANSNSAAVNAFMISWCTCAGVLGDTPRRELLICKDANVRLYKIPNCFPKVYTKLSSATCKVLIHVISDIWYGSFHSYSSMG